MFEHGQHVYANDPGATAEAPNPQPATYLRKAEDAITLIMFGTPMHEIVPGHVEVTEDTKDEGLAYPDELFATREEAEAAL